MIDWLRRQRLGRPTLFWAAVLSLVFFCVHLAVVAIFPMYSIGRSPAPTAISACLCEYISNCVLISGTIGINMDSTMKFINCYPKFAAAEQLMTFIASFGLVAIMRAIAIKRAGE